MFKNVPSVFNGIKTKLRINIFTFNIFTLRGTEG